MTTLFIATGSAMAEIVTSIGTLDQWKAFVSSVSNGDDYTGKTVTLTADITMQTSGFGSQTVGTSDKPFTGTFDGEGHTLTYANTGLKSLPYCAPFRYIKNATIKNVKIAGEISVADNNFLSGIVGYVGGASTSDISYIDNCISNITLTNSAESGDGRIGGIVGYQLATSGLQITNCIVNGTINGRGQAAGVMGYKKNGASLSVSSIFLTSTITGKVNTFVKSEGGEQSISKCYTTISSPDQGIEASSTKLSSGEIAYELQNSQTTQYWGQSNLNKSNAESLPKLTSTTEDKVIKITCTGGPLFANKGGAMPNPVSVKALSLRKWDGSKWLNGPFDEDIELNRVYNKYILNVSTTGATTLVLPGDVTKENMPANVKAYNLTYNTTKEKIEATLVDHITANMPVLINAPQGQYVLTTNNSESEITYDTENAKQNGILYGIYTATTKNVPANSYVLQDGKDGLGFYKVDEDNKIKITSFRAYLTIEGSAGSRGFIGIEDGTTGIQEAIATLDTANGDNTIYDLSGRVVTNPKKGIYIKNGKKFFVK